MAKTKREYFAELLDIVGDNDALKDFINHEVELLDKRNSAPKAPTKKQIANEGYKAMIVEGLGTDKMTVSEIVKGIFGAADMEMSNQKVSALLSQLVDDGVVIRTVEKRKAYFQVA